VRDCSQIEAMLSEYLDRDLPPETCAAIDRHLASCPACGQTARALRATVELCRDYRAGARPGPLPAEKHAAMKQALQSVLSDLRHRS